MNQDFARAVDDLSVDRARGAPDRRRASRCGTRRRSPNFLPPNRKGSPWPASRSTTALARIPNRFELTLAATNRARQITSGAAPLVEPDRDKPTVIALREIAAGKVGIEMLTQDVDADRRRFEPGHARPQRPPMSEIAEFTAAPRALPAAARRRARRARVRVLRVGAPRPVPQVRRAVHHASARGREHPRREWRLDAQGSPPRCCTT